MSTFLPVIQPARPTEARMRERSDGWLRAMRQAKLLAWVSLAWMCVEGFVGILAGVQAHSLGVVTWAASSFVEALASMIVVWRFTGHRTLSATSEARAQRWVAASFFLVAPFFAIEAVRKLIDGGDTRTTVLAIALTVSAIVLMPLLGAAKLRLGRQLESGATAGEGIQNVMCAVQAAGALIAILGAGAGLGFIDPIAALAIAGIALKEGRDAWRGQDSCCTAVPGLAPDRPSAAAGSCPDDCRAADRDSHAR